MRAARQAILPRMSFALLLTTALALAGFLVTSIQGFAVAGGASAGSMAMKTLVGRHLVYAIPTMTIFYFIGTGRLVKDEIADFPDAPKTTILKALRRFKARTSPPATFALFSAIAVFVAGGAVHTRFLPSWTHLAASILAVALHLWALVAEWRVFAENNRLMDDPVRYADSANSAAVQEER